jgi:hypothetical protein
MTVELNWTEGDAWTQAVTRRAYPASWTKLTTQPMHTPVWLADLANRRDLRGLPVRQGAECQMERTLAECLTPMAKALRTTLSQIDEFDQKDSFSYGMTQAQKALGAQLQRDRGNGHERTVTLLMQMLQVGDNNTRMQLVQTLSELSGAPASAALARLAIFDIDDDVHNAAVKALEKRPKGEYRDVLMAGFRYQWSEVADHAAQAISQVEDRAVSLALVDMLDLPDPSAPTLNNNNRWEIRELVRINHLRNCFLCHAPSTSAKEDPLRGFVPTPGGPLRQYYDNLRGLFVRADVTYLRQDFSLLLPVDDHGAWPGLQRFDFLVRTRELTAAEVKSLSAALLAASNSYPQREAVLTALRNLTGQDAGKKAEDWRRLLWRRELSAKP